MVGEIVHIKTTLQVDTTTCIPAVVTDIAERFFSATAFAPTGSMVDTAKRLPVTPIDSNKWHYKEICTRNAET